MAANPIVPVRVDEWQMRNLFNNSGYYRMVQNKTLATEIHEEKHPNVLHLYVPYCTWSQIVSYIDQNGDEVARVHQFLRPDGTIGASGRPDPKRVMVAGVKYRLQKGQTPEGKKWKRKAACPYWWLVNRIIALKYWKYPKRH